MSGAAGAALPPCPICRRPGERAWRPFCSKRCADADLGKWFSGAYAVPGEPVDPRAVGVKAAPDDGDRT